MNGLLKKRNRPKYPWYSIIKVDLIIQPAAFEHIFVKMSIIGWVLKKWKNTVSNFFIYRFEVLLVIRSSGRMIFRVRLLCEMVEIKCFDLEYCIKSRMCQDLEECRCMFIAYMQLFCLYYTYRPSCFGCMCPDRCRDHFHMIACFLCNVKLCFKSDCHPFNNYSYYNL